MAGLTKHLVRTLHLTTLMFFTSVQIQTAAFTPTPSSYSAFARTVSKLYIAGGLDTQSELTSQFMSLDLTIPWNSTAPAWTQLADGPHQYNFPAAFSSDEQTLFAFHIPETNSPWQYNVQNDTWQKATALFQHAKNDGVGAVTDPRTGLIYLAGGYHDVKLGATTALYMDIFDPISQTINTTVLPDLGRMFPVQQFYTNVWSKYMGRILYWGGMMDMNSESLEYAQSGVTELNVDSDTWITMATKGEAPATRNYHCMAANENGTMMAIYGRSLGNTTRVGELWILDLVTSTWSQGLPGPPRSAAACTIAGDQFLLWGGETGQSYNIDSPEMLIYNFTSSKYIKQYTPPTFYKDLKPPPPLTRTTAPWATKALTDPTNGNKDLSNPPVPIEAVIGGALVGLVMLGAVVAILFLQQRNGPLQDHHGLKIIGEPRGITGYSGGRRGASRGGDPQNNPHVIDEADELAKRLEMLRSRQKEIDQTRQLLVQQHQGMTPLLSTKQKRAPIALSDDKAEVISLPTPVPRLGPDTVYSMSYSPHNLHDRRTVQAVSCPIDMYQVDSYADDGPRRESDLAQDVIEPMYGPGSTGSDSIPDLVYVLPSNVGMDWTKQGQSNHPHAVLDPNVAKDIV